MDFVGRDYLVSHCSEILDGLRADFIQIAKELSYQNEKYINYYELKNILESFYDSILTKDFNSKIFKKQLSEFFSLNQDLEQFLITLIFKFSCIFNEKIIREFPNLTPACAYLSFCLKRIICEEKEENLISEPSKPVITQSIKSESIFFDNVIDGFKKAKNLNSELHFLNLYNGVKVECSGFIESIEDESILCKVTLMQILAMKEEGNAFIVSDANFPKHIKADILNINLNNKTVLLGKCERLKNMFANDRKYPRVHPNRFTKVRLQKNEQMLDGQLFDISQGGIGVISSADIGFKSGDKIRASFNLFMPISDENVSLDIELKLVVALNYKGTMRYCLQIENMEQVGIEKIISFSKLMVEQTFKDLQNKLEIYQ